MTEQSPLPWIYDEFDARGGAYDYEVREAVAALPVPCGYWSARHVN